VGVPLVYLQPFEQPPQFPLLYPQDLLAGFWPPKPLSLEAFLPQAKTVAIPVEHLHNRATAVTEGEHVPTKRIEREPLGY